MEIENLVTIIIPTYNRDKKIGEAIESALNQTYKNTQIIVIDDGSTDGTAELIKKYPQVEYYFQHNAGQASARNTGLKYSKGIFVASLDSDDVWNPDFLEKCINKLESNQLDFVFANWEQETRHGKNWDFLNNDPFLTPYLNKQKDGWITLNYEEVRSLFIHSCPSPSSSVVMRKSSIISGWDERMNIGDDWCMYLEMILNKECKVAFTMEKLWKKRVDDINVYDGRKWSEVLEFLHIADLKRNMNKFKHLLTIDEIKVLQERYMSSLVELSKHKLIREFNFIDSVKLLGTSMSMDIPFTLKTIPNIFFLGLSRKITELRKKQPS
ncbi:Glycosyltransferase involved in cell wall bisynthesis [Pedobacter sp. ok626]|uniref:glycosyltransferase family 2 protein n=1 Tax=Pedobacter sp. ok626 TaxID=1761882 RepID=UPI00088FEAA6|nr:glycosyltransferase family 2 protein [Pedobacter sp. ok626]SDJ56492.1 Glycosyltransferase involved in cell wall bisynthesis [Pedobacter sp. ok626]